MDKYDVKKAHRELYAPTVGEFHLVEVPPMTALAVDGHGDPNTSADYAAAVEALYGVSYTLKFESKNELGRDFVVGPLEALWSADDMTAFTARDKGAWNWTVMIVQPDWLDAGMVHAAIAYAATHKQLAALDEVRILPLQEGTCVQTLHVGPYDAEGPTLARLHDEYMPANGWTFNGRHHEIYLSDARRTAPHKLRTILRQPVARA